MSSEDRDLELIAHLQSFALALESETGEAIRPVLQTPTADLAVERGVDLSILEPEASTSSRRQRRHWLWPAIAAAATIVVVVGGLVVLSTDSPPADDRAPAQTVDPTPDSSAPPATTVTTETPVRTTEAPAPAPEIAATTTSPNSATTWNGGLLGDLEVEGLLPLASVNDGDFVVPTAPVDWRILSGGFGTHSAGFSNSTITIIEALPDGTTGPSILLDVSILGVCVDRGLSSCETSGDSTEINGVVWQSFTELKGARGKVGDLFIDVQVNDPELNGSVLDDLTVVEYLEGLRVGTGDDYWDTIRTEVKQACWTCSDAQDPDETDSEPLTTSPE